MIKTIVKLYERACDKGFARINGRYEGYGTLEEKYSVEVDGQRVTLKHWGTTTLIIDGSNVEHWYGQSKSDADSMNTLLRLLDIDGKFRFFPSRYEFVFEGGN